VDKRKLQEKINKLKRLAQDQKGTPEGDLALDAIKRITEKYPDLNIDINDKLIQWQKKFDHEFDFNLWYMACRAHDLKILRYNVDDYLEIITEGLEVDMIIAKTEWAFSKSQFKEMATQVVRGIVNKLWPQACKKPKDIPDYKESEYSDFAHKAQEATKTMKKALKKGK